MSNVLKIAAAGGVTEETDEHFENTVLLLHGDGTNGAQNNTFLDSSTNNFTITRNGNTTQGTFSPFSKPDGGWGNYFDGTDDYLQAASNAISATGEFSFECWIYTPDVTTRQHIASQYTNGSTNGRFFIATSYSSAGTVSFNTPQITAATGNVLVANRWTHIVLTRTNINANPDSDYRIFVDGVLSAYEPYTGTTSRSLDTARTRIGGEPSSTTTGYYEGYISNCRVVTGIAPAYQTASTTIGATIFTPPTAPLTNISNTSILTCQSNRFIDNSANAFAITRNGNVLVTPFSPYPLTTAYSPSINGGAGAFDGSTDYLDVGSDSNLTIGTNDFTISMWVYFDALPGAANLFEGRPSTSANALTPTIQYATGTNDWLYVVNGSVVINGSVATIGQWYYVVVSRLSGTTRMFINGSQIGSDYSDTNDYVAFAADRPRIGDRGNNSGPGVALDGYISGLEVLIGTGYSSVTVPTAPPTSTANTELLLNFTNGGIFDNTCFNTFETVNSAQIDTTVKKYGTGSIEFDGTTDYLYQSFASETLTLGSGDWTIEFWFYLNALPVSGSFVFLDQRPASTNGIYPTITVESTGTLRFFVNGSNRISSSSGAVSGSTWYHLAICKSSGFTKMFLDGTQVGSTYTDNNTYLNSRTVIGSASYNLGASTVNGFVDDLRISRVARYTTTFTPPDKEFPSIGE
jgi:hypothetical protein